MEGFHSPSLKPRYGGFYAGTHTHKGLTHFRYNHKDDYKHYAHHQNEGEDQTQRASQLFHLSFTLGTSEKSLFQKAHGNIQYKGKCGSQKERIGYPYHETCKDQQYIRPLYSHIDNHCKQNQKHQILHIFFIQVHTSPLLLPSLITFSVSHVPISAPG